MTRHAALGVRRVLPPLLALIMLLFAGLILSGRLRLEPVLTGSMAPHYPAGTLVAVTPVDAHTLHVGDVVMFVPPRPYGTPTGGPIMHRVLSIGSAPDGHLQLRTKGDANAAADPWVLDGDKGGFARLRASSVLAGRALVMVRSTARFPAALVWPGLALLVVARHRTRKGHKADAPSRPSAPAIPRPRHYEPKHAASRGRPVGPPRQ